MVNKKLVIIVTIIVTILVVAIVYIGLQKSSKEIYLDSNEFTENKIENKIDDTIENKLDNEIDNVSDEENFIEENEYNENEENIIEDDKNNTVSNTTEETKVEKEQTDEEKAMSLVKKEWGENDNTVYYYIEEQVSDSVYIISVRDQETTEDLSSYRVDIDSNEVKKD